jgi:hypothetical protein
MLHYLKGLLAPFCLSSKRYQIPFCNLPKGISYRMQNPKNPILRLPLEPLQKIIKYPLEQIAGGICELHATPIIGNIPLTELNLK